MIAYRLSKPEERQELIRFANTVFNAAGDPIEFEGATPKVYASEVDSSSYHMIAYDDEKGIRAVVGMLPEKLHIGEEELTVGYVGTVSVHPESRSEGHMKKLMQLTLERAQREGYDLLYLGGRKQRYAYFGYETSGLFYEATISPDNVRHGLKEVQADGICFCEILPGSLLEEKAQELHRSEWLYAEREPFVVCARTYHAIPYAVLQKEEFIGYVIERQNSVNLSELLAFSEEAEYAIIKAWMNRNPTKTFAVTIPGWKLPQLKRMASYAEGTIMGTNGRVHVLHWKKTIEALLKLKAESCRLYSGEMSLSVDGETFTISVSGNYVSVTEGAEHPEVLEHSQAERFLFDPYAFGAEGNWFPLPLFFPQADEF